MNINTDKLDSLPDDYSMAKMAREWCGQRVYSLAELEDDYGYDMAIVGVYGEIMNEEIAPGWVLSVMLRGYETNPDVFRWAYHCELYRLAQDGIYMAPEGAVMRFGDMDSAREWLEARIEYR